MKLLGSTKKVVDEDKNGEHVPELEIVEVVLVHCNLIKKWLSACLEGIIYFCAK